MKAERKRKRVLALSDGKSLTQQQYRDGADVNHIMARYQRTGLISSVTNLHARFADVSAIGDYRSVLDRVTAAGEAFLALPSRVRERFANDPTKLLYFLQDPQNEDEARNLGLLKPKPKAEASASGGSGEAVKPGSAAGAPAAGS